MALFKLHYWPIFTALWLLATFVTSYVTAVLNDHVDALFPFISDTGTVPPESCVFGQMLNLGALFMFITLYLRHRQIGLILNNIPKFNHKRWNFWSAFFGTLSCLGISIVANFQETSVLSMHGVGAFMAFGLGAIYFIIQDYITWKSPAGKPMKYTRIVLSFLVIALYITTMVCLAEAFEVFDGDNRIKWDSDNEGYELRLAATFSEWLMAITMGLYVVTFTSDLKQIEFDEICFTQSKYSR